MFERLRAPLLPRRLFLARLAKSGLVFVALIGGALGLGTAGYHWICALPWMDALLNASMILTGMGPVDRMATSAAKMFASAYALFSGVVFLSSIGVLVAPVLHRFMHRFHLEEDAEHS